MTDYNQGIDPKCYTIAGITSAVVSRAVGQPLDVLKIRFQLQDYRDGHLKYRGVSSATHTMLVEEGISALWKGHVPAQVLSIIYGVVQFNSYEFTRNYIYKYFPHYTERLDFRTTTDFICGGLSGVASTLACQPVDVLRTRLVAQEKRVYRGIWHGLHHMLKENGFRTFYKGLVPSLCMVFPYIGFHFSFYGLFKHIWLGYAIQEEHSRISLLLCGAASGVCSKLILLPFDMVKKRLQVVGFHSNNAYEGMFDCFYKMVKHQGFFVLYRGVSPSLLKAAVVTSTSFFVYEQFVDFCRNSTFISSFKNELKP